MILALLAGVVLQASGSSQSRRDSIAKEVSQRAADRASRSARRAAARAEREARPTRRPVTEEDLATAFKDPSARTLLTRARAARLSQDSALLSYDVNSYQRISAGLGFSRLGRDRLIFRTEHAGRVRWQRDVGIWVDVTGARTVLPGIPEIGEREARKGIARAGGEMLPVPYFPGYEPLWAGPEAAQVAVDENGPVHPLAEGSEAYYTYSTGDSLTMTLPDHRVIHLRALDVRPREAKWNLVVGSLWFDEASGQLVRAAFRFAVPMHIDEFVLEEDPTAFDDVPAWVKPMMFPMHGEVSAIAIEYGMYGGRFWLPRNRAAEGTATASFMRIPFKIEQTFKYNSVNGTDSLPRIPLAPSIAFPPDSLTGAARQAWRDSVMAVRNRAMRARSDSIRAGLYRRRPFVSQCDTSEIRVSASRRFGEAHVPVATRTPCDLAALETSPDLPASIYDPGDQLFDLSGRQALIDQALSMEAQPPFTLNPHALPHPDWASGLSLVRYNRIEGLSAGAEVSQILGGGYSAQAIGRFGIADRIPSLELSLTRTNLSRSIYATGYKRLVPAGDWGNPLSFGSSVSAVLFGRDEGFYYRAAGGELGFRTEEGTPIDIRLFSERERTAAVETKFSLGGNNATPNLVATSALYSGAALRIRQSHGDDPNGFRVFTDLRLEGATRRDTTYGRGALDFTVTEGIGPYAAALTLSGGSSVGTLPAQRRWYLGGTHTIRGQSPDTAQSGNAFWMARLETGRTIQGVRPVVFGDVGWTGDRNQMQRVGRPLTGVGAGASFFDGLLRFDVARGSNPRRQWRVDGSIEAVF
jgi:type II secretory pathway pseudopilin PulG